MTLFDATLLSLAKDKKSYFSTLVSDILTVINPFIIKQTYEYHEGGEVKKLVIASFDNKVILTKKWFKDGQLKSIKPVNGLYEKWYSREDGGHLHERCIYLNGLEHGLHETWYSAANGGGRMICCTFHLGIRSLYQRWHNVTKEGEGGGHLSHRYSYKDGNLHGLYERWYTAADGGHLSRRCSYKDGNLHGLYERWYNAANGGHLSERCTYKNDKLDGLYEWWYNASNGGQLLERCTYKDGEKDGLYEVWHIRGHLTHRCTYQNGIKL